MQKYYSCNPSTCICETSKCLKSIVHTSVTESDEVITANIIETKKINTIATNVTSTASINWHGKKVRDCYILDSVLLVITLILIIFIIIYPLTFFIYNKSKCSERGLNIGAIFYGNVIKYI